MMFSYMFVNEIVSFLGFGTVRHIFCCPHLLPVDLHGFLEKSRHQNPLHRHRELLH